MDFNDSNIQCDQDSDADEDEDESDGGVVLSGPDPHQKLQVAEIKVPSDIAPSYVPTRRNHTSAFFGWLTRSPLCSSHNPPLPMLRLVCKMAILLNYDVTLISMGATVRDLQQLLQICGGG